MHPLKPSSLSQTRNPVHRVFAAAFAITVATASALAAEPQRTPLTLMVPQRPFATAWEQALQQQIVNFQQKHPGIEVALIKRGKDFSSLPDFVAAGYMGEGPHAFLIEAAEVEALEHTKQAKPHPLWLGAAITLYADQEILFRHHLDPLKLPTQWSELTPQVALLTAKGSARPLGVPVLSSRGPWILEALHQPQRAWSRESSGIRFSKSLLPLMDRLRNHAQVQLGWEEAVQQFLNRKLAFVLGSSEWEPFLKEKAEFRFGSVAWKGPRMAYRWATRTKLEPGQQAQVDAWIKWMYRPETLRALSQATGLLSVAEGRSLPSDPAIMNIQHEWTQSLRDFFSSHKTESDAAILAALEVRLASSLPH